MTTITSEQHGYLRRAMACGLNKEVNLWAPELWGNPIKVLASQFPQTGIQPSWELPVTAIRWVPHGCSLEAEAYGLNKGVSWSAQERLEAHIKMVVVFLPMATH